MSSTLIVTSYNKRLEEQYAHRFFSSYKGELDTMLVSEDILSSGATHTIPLTAHEHFVRVNAWRQTRDFKQDAVRFCHKPYSIWTAVYDVYEPHEQGKYDSLMWIDADTVFKRPITQDWVDDTFKHDGIMTYMGRPNYHSETGVLWFNLNNPSMRDYIESVIELYNTNKIYELDETHDSYVWDWTRRKTEAMRNKEKHRGFKNIGVDHKVSGGHIQAYLFGEYMDHLKGSKRKQQGYSKENRSNS